MFDDYNKNQIPEGNGRNNNADNPVNTNDRQDQAGASGETPVNEPKRDGAPEGTQDQNYYNGYQAPDGQYRIVYNRSQSDGRTNPYSYGQQQYGSYQNYGGHYGYRNPQQPYQQQYRQPAYTREQPQNEQTKKTGGKTALIIAVCLAAVIVCSVLCLAAGLMIGKNNANNADGKDKASVSDKVTENTDKLPENTNPLTDSSARVNSASSGEYLLMTEAAAKTVDSVVEISTEKTVQGSFMQQYVVQGGGSGVIITEDGYIATNNHVIENATQIKVTLRNGKSYTGTLVGSDSIADLAVIKIDAKGLSPATFGDSSKLVVAETVFAIGNPLGELGGTVTQGIISALERTITIDSKAMTLLQTTAAINPGNSGGGLFNLAGECVGIVNAKSSGSGIEGLAFAIPSNTAKKVIEDIMQYGYVRGRVMLGINMVDITDQYSLYRYGLDEYGVYISRITEGSDAERSGIQAVDRLVSIGGTNVVSSTQAMNLIQSHSVGDTLEIVVSRNGKQMTFNVTLTEYIPSSGSPMA